MQKQPPNTSIPSQLGCYQRLTRLGSGGMATVYRAELVGEDGWSKKVAIKVPHPHLVSQPQFLSSFISEARLGALLSHPNIVALTDYAKVDGHPYLVMEYVEGISLRELVAIHVRDERQIPFNSALSLVIEVCRGLEYAHKAKDHQGRLLRIVHRDIKPANVLISSDGKVKIADFGVARSDSNVEQTKATGMLKGSLHYMSPEQASGSRQIDGRSDLFSAGLMLFELLCLEPLYPRDTFPQMLKRVLEAEVEARLQAIPTGPEQHNVIQLLTRALAREPSDRFQTGAEMVEGLETLLPPLHSRIALERWLHDEVPKPRADRSDAEWLDVTTPSNSRLCNQSDGSMSLQLDDSGDFPDTGSESREFPPELLVQTKAGVPDTFLQSSLRPNRTPSEDDIRQTDAHVGKDAATVLLEGGSTVRAQLVTPQASEAEGRTLPSCVRLTRVEKLELASARVLSSSESALRPHSEPWTATVPESSQTISMFNSGVGTADSIQADGPPSKLPRGPVDRRRMILAALLLTALMLVFTTSIIGYVLVSEESGPSPSGSEDNEAIMPESTQMEAIQPDVRVRPSLDAEIRPRFSPVPLSSSEQDGGEYKPWSKGDDKGKGPTPSNKVQIPTGKPPPKVVRKRNRRPNPCLMSTPSVPFGTLTLNSPDHMTIKLNGWVFRKHPVLDCRVPVGKYRLKYRDTKSHRTVGIVLHVDAGTKMNCYPFDWNQVTCE